MTQPRPRAFTLLEILIVIIVLAVLVATILPQFIPSGSDMREDSLGFNLSTLRSAIEQYKLEHKGAFPNIIQGANNEPLPQLTHETRTQGSVNTSTTSDPVFYPHAPCLPGIPLNPFNGLNSVAQSTGTPSESGTGESGWAYNPATGEIWPNHRVSDP